MSSLAYYVIDTETTGLVKGYHEMTEVSIIRAKDRMQLSRPIMCEFPDRASIDALRITGKTLADLARGDSREQVVAKMDRFFNEDGLTPNHRVIVGHNIISFDKKFLHALYESVSKEFPASMFLDTIHLTNDYLKTADLSTLKITKTATGKISKKLVDACDMLMVKRASTQHNAKADAQSTFFLWQKLIELGVDYLPHIKTYPHNLPKDEDLIDFDAADLEAR
jgi:DNA polymerase III epsilon subunit-like protein